jgi:hypothetical protein
MGIENTCKSWPSGHSQAESVLIDTRRENRGFRATGKGNEELPFQDLNELIRTKRGPIRVGDATIADLREYIEILEAEEDAPAK